jgi:hypothetical protein
MPYRRRWAAEQLLEAEVAVAMDWPEERPEAVAAVSGAMVAPTQLRPPRQQPIQAPVEAEAEQLPTTGETVAMVF